MIRILGLLSSRGGPTVLVLLPGRRIVMKRMAALQRHWPGMRPIRTALTTAQASGPPWPVGRKHIEAGAPVYGTGMPLRTRFMFSLSVALTAPSPVRS